MICFYVIGSDKRTIHIKEMLEVEGRVVDKVDEADYVIAPTPFTKDKEMVFGTNILISSFVNKCKNKVVFAGAIPKDVKKKFEDNNISYYDLMEYDDIAFLNAIPTAEGAIMTAITATSTTLCNSNACVLGYGRIGKVLSKMLCGIGAKVYCEARNQKDLAQIIAMGYNIVSLKELDDYLPSFDYIFNTIPDIILNQDRLNLVKEDVCIVDLASAPYGVDFDYAKNRGINAILASALPSKVAPKSAAIYFKQKIDQIVENI